MSKRPEKRDLTPAERLNAALAMQILILDALMSVRAWRPNEIAFQGGTSLKLAYGSARFSEDLDFLLAQEMADSVREITESAFQRVREAMAVQAPGDSITLRAGRRNGNTLPFTFVRTSDRFRNSIRVKVDFQLVPKVLINAYEKQLTSLALPPQLRAGVQTMLPAAKLDSIYADKILAVAGRPYFKPRDFFDLWWLRTQQGIKAPAEQENLLERIATAAAMYGKTTADVLAGLEKFLRERQIGEIAGILERDLPRWVPEPMVKQFHQHGTWHSIAQFALADLAAAVEFLRRRGVEGAGNQA
jgi:predicted nucleotidyltransferase component of viral defense system